METVKFEELGLYPQLLRAIKEMGFEEATPIQSQAIPVVMSGVDVIGQAQTGTGKTASFGIPLLMKVDPNNKKTQAIVLSPTRELAIQSAEEIRKLAKYMHGIKVLPIYGGQDISRQIKALKGGATIIIGTPGRVMDHLRRKTIRCDYINTIVLDEADEMLNMGFREDIETILSYIPDEDRQTVLFSATMPKPILEITRKFQHDATTIKVTKKELTVPNIDQYYYDVRRNDKMEVLIRNHVMEMNDDGLEYIRNNYKSHVKLYINQNVEPYLNLISADNFRYDEALYILGMDIEDNKKIALLELTAKPVSVVGKKYSTALIEYILDNNFDEHDERELYLHFSEYEKVVQSAIYRVAESRIDDIIADSALVLDDTLLSELLNRSRCSLDDKIQLWAKAIPHLTEETCKKHFDELGFPELKGIFTKRNNYSKTYEDTSDVREILNHLKKNTWIYDYRESNNGEGIVVIKNPVRDKKQ